ncbi:MAG: hypothetical protein K2X39_00405 [Silvanigrellaceae bacterium]|nr:hypothetical protein [Silvanigrellaceae bacterium]
MSSTSTTIEKMAFSKGQYYLVETSKISDLYRAAGLDENSDKLPNFITIDGKECLFTENFIEKNGKEFEIVMIAEGFSWEDIIVYEDDESYEEEE